MKSISKINPAIMENMECLIAKARPVIDLKVDVSLNHSVSLCFVSLPHFMLHSMQRITLEVPLPAL